MVFSSEQQKIIDFIPELLNSNSMDSIAIKAFAGCGKSFILKQITKLFADKKFLGLAFNNSIVKENKKSFPKKNSKWFTLHGLAKEYLKKFNVKIDFKNARGEYKPLELIEIMGFSDRGQFQFAVDIGLVFKIFTQSSLKEITPQNIIKAAKSQKNEDVLSINKKILGTVCKQAEKLWGMFERNEIAPTFDFYLKYFEVKGFAKKIEDFDVVMLDEAQDSNAVTMSIIAQIPAKKIFVGDEHQSIYGFRGTINALNYADKLFYLSATFRYIPKIADFATKILQGYKLEKVPIKSYAKNERVDGKKAFLSRNNSSMIALIDELITKDIQFKTIKDPKELFSAAIALLEIRTEGRTTEKGFGYLNEFKRIEEVEDYIEETGDREIITAYKMQKRYGKKLYILKSKAVKMYKSRSDDIKIYLSTAHTSKGLEWDEVELLRDFPDIQNLLKDAKITSPQQLMKRFREGDFKAYNIIQEINLYYVAVTRGRVRVD